MVTSHHAFSGGASTSSVTVWVASAGTTVDYGSPAGVWSALYDCAGAIPTASQAVLTAID